MADCLMQNFIRQLYEIQQGSPWFDQSFREKLEPLTEQQVFRNPLPGIHSVAEHVSHMLEWRKECIRRFHGEKYELMHSPEDWIPTAVLQQRGWKPLLEELYASTGLLAALIEGRDDQYLDTVFRDTGYTNKYLMEGIIHHDIYHLGQIGVCLRLLQDAL